MLGEELEDIDLTRPDYIYERKCFLNSLESQSPKSVQKFVGIVLGNRWSRNFCKWLRVVHGVKPEQVLSRCRGQQVTDYFLLGKFAMEYLGISREKVISCISPLLNAGLNQSKTESISS
jgi:hypothetical protein